jgi:hypothetical protein
MPNESLATLANSAQIETEAVAIKNLTARNSRSDKCRTSARGILQVALDENTCAVF